MAADSLELGWPSSEPDPGTSPGCDAGGGAVPTVDLDVLIEVVGHDATDVIRSLAELIEAGHLVAVGESRSLALDASEHCALSTEMPDAVRRDLHHRAFAAKAGRGVRPTLLVAHLSGMVPGSRPWLDTVERALCDLDHPGISPLERIGAARTLVEQLDDSDPRRDRAGAALIDATTSLGDVGAVLDALATVRVNRAVHTFENEHERCVVHELALRALLEPGATDTVDVDATPRIRLESLIADLYRGIDPSVTRRRLEEHATSAGVHEPVTAVVRAGAIAWCAAIEATADTAALVDAALAAFDVLDDDQVASDILGTHLVAQAALNAERLLEAEVVASRGARVAAATGNHHLVAICELTAVRSLIFQGRVAEAEPRLAIAVERLGAGGGALGVFAAAIEAFLLTLLDDEPRARRRVEAVVAVLSDSPRSLIAAGTWLFVAHAHATLGDVEQAADRVLTAGGGPDLHEIPAVDRVYCYEMLAQCALASDDMDLAHLWTLRATRSPGGPMARAAAARTESLVAQHQGRPLDARESAVRARAAAESAGGLLEAAKARLLEARCRPHAERSAAVGDLRAVFRTGHDLGAGSVTRDAARHLRRIGRSGAIPITGSELTPREAEVARLVADGLTNQAIAETLRIGVRTAETHVARALEKLDVPSRSAVARALDTSVPTPAPTEVSAPTSTIGIPVPLLRASFETTSSQYTDRLRLEACEQRRRGAHDAARTAQEELWVRSRRLAPEIQASVLRELVEDRARAGDLDAAYEAASQRCHLAVRDPTMSSEAVERRDQLAHLLGHEGTTSPTCDGELEITQLRRRFLTGHLHPTAYTEKDPPSPTDLDVDPTDMQVALSALASPATSSDDARRTVSGLLSRADSTDWSDADTECAVLLAWWAFGRDRSHLGQLLVDRIPRWSGWHSIGQALAATRRIRSGRHSRRRDGEVGYTRGANGHGADIGRSAPTTPVAELTEAAVHCLDERVRNDLDHALDQVDVITHLASAIAPSPWRSWALVEGAAALADAGDYEDAWTLIAEASGDFDLVMLPAHERDRAATTLVRVALGLGRNDAIDGWVQHPKAPSAETAEWRLRRAMVALDAHVPENAVALLTPLEFEVVWDRITHLTAMRILASALRLTGDEQQAASLLATYRPVALRSGAWAEAAIMASDLRMLGQAPTSLVTTPSSVVGLTGRQAQIAGLVARGYTNDQIARSLSISRRTVESHLTDTYRRLGVRSRNELVRTLHRP